MCKPSPFFHTSELLFCALIFLFGKRTKFFTRVSSSWTVSRCCPIYLCTFYGSNSKSAFYPCLKGPCENSVCKPISEIADLSEVTIDKMIF